MADNFETRIPEPALETLMKVAARIGFDPLSSPESENFCAELIDQFAGPPEELEEWLQPLADSFNSVGARPIWIQNPDWPFTTRGPMTFVGQIDIPRGLFHDEASFYTFYEPETGVVKTILQVA